MKLFERILVPTDLSPFAETALDYALLFRRQLGSRITLLYADEPSFTVNFPEYPLGYYIDNAPDARLHMQDRLRELALLKAPMGGIETMVIDDSPARAIIMTARGMEADLIVMGTHGRSGWRRALLGSVTEAVLRSAVAPVLTVTPSLHGPDGEIRRVLCPVSAMNQGAFIATALGAELLLMAVVDDDPAERLIALAERRHTDLIVTNSTKQHITRVATVPVLTLPPDWHSVTGDVVARHREAEGGIATLPRGRT